MYEISELKQKGDPLGFEKAKFFKKRICNQKTRTVYCCEDQKPPTDEELNILVIILEE